MKVLFVYPEFPDTYWSFRHALRFVGKRSAFPPLALLTVSSMLPASWERRLVDLNVRRLKASDIEWADIVLATAMLVQRDSLHDIVKRCKAKGKPVAIGGPYVTTTLEMVDADYIFLGEAETTVPEFLKDLERGEAKHIYKAPERPPLSTTPVPDFQIAELKRYSSMSVQFSRGCPFSCEFCDIIEIYGRVPRTKSNAQMMGELDALHSAGWRGPVFIVDDNFIGNKKNVRRLMPELAAWQERHDFPFGFFTEASVNLADDDALLRDMRAAGFYRVFLGIETPVEESLIEAQKTQNRGNLLESVNKIQSYGMEVMAGFIVGFDNDPEDIFQRQINFIRDSAIPLAMVGLLNALPDTQLWRRLKSEGRLLAESDGNNTNCSLNFVPKMDPARLIEGYKSIMQTIYSPAEYYERALNCLGWLRHAMGTTKSHNKVNFRNVAALTRIVFKLGIRDRERTEFWRFFRQVLKNHRARFEQAMSFAATGYHFRKLTEAYWS